MIYQILITIIFVSIIFFYCALSYKIPYLLIFAGVILGVAGASLLVQGQGTIEVSLNNSITNNSVNSSTTYYYENVNQYHVTDMFSNMTGLVLTLIGLAFTLEGANLQFKQKSLIR